MESESRQGEPGRTNSTGKPLPFAGLHWSDWSGSRRPIPIIAGRKS